MKIFIIFSLKSALGFGYMSTNAVSKKASIVEILFHTTPRQLDQVRRGIYHWQQWHGLSQLLTLLFRFQVKEQILDCKEAAVLCNALCGNHGADHQAFQEINKDDVFDATVNVAIKNGMYKNQEMCRICSSKLG